MIFAVEKRNDVSKNFIGKALEKLKRIPGIIQLLEQSNCALLLSPRAACSFINSGLPICKLAAVIDCLKQCHQQGVVHRDVWPSNILVSSSNKIILTD